MEKIGWNTTTCAIKVSALSRRKATHLIILRQLLGRRGNAPRMTSVFSVKYEPVLSAERVSLGLQDLEKWNDNRI